MLYSIYMAHTTKFDARKAAKRLAWAEKIADERDRRRPNRAQTIPDARKAASKKACRKGGWD